MPRVLVTGSAGLIGRPLCAALRLAGYAVKGFDLRVAGDGRQVADDEYGDVRDAASLRRAMTGCDGVIHLAAMSRVLEAESAPEACHATNVGGVRNVLAAIDVAGRHAEPWLVFASSREIYGNPASLPADEDTPAQPINRYAASKVEGERLLAAAAAGGRRAMIVRFSNVYGSVADYPDRVVPAFAMAAAHGGRLVVRGPDQVLDFTHIEDLVRGLLRLVAVFGDARVDVPTLHFVTGRGTSLGELAAMSAAHSATGCEVVEAPKTGIHVGRFIGCGARARRWLDWAPEIEIEDGLRRLVQSYADRRGQAA